MAGMAARTGRASCAASRTRSTRRPATSPPPRRWAPACRSPRPGSRPHGRRALPPRRRPDHGAGGGRRVPRSGQSGYVVARPAGVAGLITPWRTPFLAQARAVAPALPRAARSCSSQMSGRRCLPCCWRRSHRGGSARRRAQHRARLPPPQGPRRPGAGRPGRPPRRGPAVVRRRGRRWTAGHARGRQRTARTWRPSWPAPRPASSSPTPTSTRRPTARCSAPSRSTASDAPPPRRSSSSAPSTTPSSAASPSERTASASVPPPTRRRRSGRCRTPSSTRSSPPACGSASGKARGWQLADDSRPGLPEGNYLAADRARRRDPVDAGLHRAVCGPVVRVTPFDTDEEAVSLASTVTRPTAAYLWTRPAAGAPAGASHRVGEHLGELPQPTGPARRRPRATRPGGPGAAAAVNVDFYTQSRTVLIAADDTPRAAVRSLTGERSHADRLHIVHERSWDEAPTAAIASSCASSANASYGAARHLLVRGQRERRVLDGFSWALFASLNRHRTRRSSRVSALGTSTDASASRRERSCVVTDPRNQQPGRQP